MQLLELPPPQKKSHIVSNAVPRFCKIKGQTTHVEGHLQDIFGDLLDAWVTQFSWHTHPGVGRHHGVAQVLDGDDDHSVWYHCGDHNMSGLQKEK